MLCVVLLIILMSFLCQVVYSSGEAGASNKLIGSVGHGLMRLFFSTRLLRNCKIRKFETWRASAVC